VGTVLVRAETGFKQTIRITETGDIQTHEATISNLFTNSNKTQVAERSSEDSMRARSSYSNRCDRRTIFHMNVFH
jgi:hypothetical protein